MVIFQNEIFWGLFLAWLGNGLGALSPGPNMVAVASTGLSSGRRPAVVLAAGIATGAIVWCLSMTLGLGRLFEVFPHAETVIGLFGAAYLLFLGQKNIRSAQSARIGKLISAETLTAPQAWMRGLTINLTNPKSALFWMSIATYFQSLGIGLWALLIFVATVSTQSFLIYGSYGVIFSLPSFQRLFERFAFYFELMFGVVFLLIGISLLWSVSSSVMNAAV